MAEQDLGVRLEIDNRPQDVRAVLVGNTAILKDRGFARPYTEAVIREAELAQECIRRYPDLAPKADYDAVAQARKTLYPSQYSADKQAREYLAFRRHEITKHFVEIRVLKVDPTENSVIDRSSAVVGTIDTRKGSKQTLRPAVDFSLDHLEHSLQRLKEQDRVDYTVGVKHLYTLPVDDVPSPTDQPSQSYKRTPVHRKLSQHLKSFVTQ